MSLTTCTIRISQHPERVVLMSRPLYRTLQLSARSITFRFGSKSVNLPIKLLRTNGNLISVPAAVAASVRLPWSGTCSVNSDGGREVQVGPLVGVLTTLTANAAAPFGSRTAFLREIIRAASGRAILFAFAPNGVDWQQETVTGYFPSSDGRWVRKTIPLPDVVYNRLPSRSADKSIAMETFKDRFVRRRIPLFNWSFFDKSDVYRLLDDNEFNRYVPESRNGPVPEDIRRMMEKHRFVYLKPTAGSLGIGIYRLTYNPGRGYFARYRRGSTNQLIRFPRFEGLVNMLNRHGVKLQNYVVQQGIRLIEQDNCPIDFRFHMTKNGQNEWIVSGIGAKKAGRGSVTTHVRTGGSLMTPEQVLSRVFGNRSDPVLRNAKEVAVKLAEAIEKRYPHPLGELGFDLGIDQNERVWMFEANAKPGRSIFKHPSLKEQGKNSLSTLIDHCLYLSRFSARREE